MNLDEKYLRRCLEIAYLGFGKTAPNPMVGAVIVYEDKIIGEGYHCKFGDSHAEVNAINSVKNKDLLKSCTLYVNLEPCCHFGKTPPCTDLILKYKIPRIVIGSQDTSKDVNGKGIKILKKSGCNIAVGILEKECRELNRFFFTSNEKQRPYVILKWAQTKDGFIDKLRDLKFHSEPERITDDITQILVHKWRAEIQSILVGKNTAIYDNPNLTVRKWSGKNPVRIVIDKELSLPSDLNLFDGKAATIIFTEKDCDSKENLEFCRIDFNENINRQILAKLFRKNIQSLIVEGGGMTINSFIKENLWDEARVLIADKYLKTGIKMPEINEIPISKSNFSNCIIYTYINSKNSFI